MRRIDSCFAELRANGRKALIPFITAGDPSLEATVPVMHALVRAGADVIELGVPFSDPMADGPTIQRSSERALARGAGLAYVLEAVHEFRREDATTPVVLMGYLNPIEIHGTRRFAEAAVAAGVDGVLLVDLPPEEAGETRTIFTEVGLALIALASPTTSEQRLDMLCSTAQGYLYYVSFAGVTGASICSTPTPPAIACASCVGVPARPWWPASASRMRPAPLPWPWMPTAWWWAVPWSLLWRK